MTYVILALIIWGVVKIGMAFFLGALAGYLFACSAVALAESQGKIRR